MEIYNLKILMYQLDTLALIYLYDNNYINEYDLKENCENYSKIEFAFLKGMKLNLEVLK